MLFIKSKKNTTTTLSLYVIFVLGLLFYSLSSCSRDLEVKAVGLTFESLSSEVVEGEYLTYDLQLSKASSQDIILLTEFDISENFLNYTNKEDYTPVLECSYDDGKTWSSEKKDDQRLRLVSSHKSFKIRIPTLDDKNLEVLREGMVIKFTLENADKVTILGTIPKLEATIMDNDVPLKARLELDKEGYVAGFSRTEEGVLKYVAVGTSAKTAKEKKIVDEIYKEAIKMLEDLHTSEMPVLDEVYLYADSTDLTSASVSPLELEDGKKDLSRWVMDINLFKVYTGEKSSKKTSFNEDGGVASLLVHELGHLLTLGVNQRKMVKSSDTCKNPKVYIREPKEDEESCFSSNSYVRRFTSDYYDISSTGILSPKDDLSFPEFVSEYAETNYSEDLSETFASYVAKGDKSPKYSDENAAYLNKIAFFDQYSQAKGIKASMINKGYKFKDIDENNHKESRAYRPARRMNCVGDVKYLNLKALF